MEKTEKIEQLVQLGRRIRHIRRMRDITQENLAEDVGISRNYLAAVEAGSKQVTLLKLFKMADALGVSPARFFED